MNSKTALILLMTDYLWGYPVGEHPIKFTSRSHVGTTLLKEGWGS